MSEMVNLNEDPNVIKIREKINELRKQNTEYKKIINNTELRANVRDDYIMKIEDDEFQINELLSEMKQPTIVPATGTDIVAHHKNTKRRGSFGPGTFSMKF
jgi:hypothetical protein